MTTATNNPRTFGHSTINAFYQSRHHLDGCAGRWPTSCRAAFPRTRQAWCKSCQGVVS